MAVFVPESDRGHAVYPVRLSYFVVRFAASAFGTLLGALPKIPTGAKQGLCTAIACTLSLFSGLYGSFAMQLSDLIAQRTPVLSLLNPAQQITHLFSSLPR